MRVFLIHGMGRSPLSLALLAHRLERRGHRTTRFGYLVTRSPLETIARDFSAHVAEVLAEDAERRGPRTPRHRPHTPRNARARAQGTELAQGSPPAFAVVGHSLGNLITRIASPSLPPGFSRFVMLAPPNQPPVLARALRHNPVFRALTRDAGARLQDPGFYAALPIPEVPTLIIAGTGGPTARFLPFAGKASDGVVCVHECQLPGVPIIEVPAIHTFIMNHSVVTEAVASFLEHGAVSPPAAER